jgi:SAM-dependent methyltransferase
MRIDERIVSSLNEKLLCLSCAQSSLHFEKHKIVCKNCGSEYPVVRDIPILLKAENKIFPTVEFLADKPKSQALVKRRMIAIAGKFLPSISVNLSSKRCIKRYAELLAETPEALILVVGGGKQREWLDKRFVGYPNIRLIYTDIDRDALVDYICDAHDLPFMDSTFDGVITTAVLQHVLYPEKAIAEICRVLKPSGLIYSEFAFMQQVIEGAYDFTRYTLSGHRRVFNYFNEIDSGLVAGPATVLVWSIENFVLAFFKRKALRLPVKSLVRLMFFWVKYFDYYLKTAPSALDGASCTYFLGSKCVEKTPDLEIIKRYSGAKHLEHM